jgi:hypothetical protein
MAFDFGSIVGNVASGGLLGILGSGLNIFGAIWQNREARAAKKEEHAQEMAKLELAARIDLQKAEQNLRETEAKAVASGFDASQAADANAHGASDWVADFKALTRHVVVYMLILISACIYFFKSTDETQQLIASIVLQLATMAITWLYGQRAQIQVLNYLDGRKTK